MMERKMPRIAVLVAGALDCPGRSPEELEQDVERVMSVLEDDAADLAIGPAVGCDFERLAIDVRFSVEADNSAEVHRRIGNVTEMIDEAVEGQVRTSMTPAEQVE